MTVTNFHISQLAQQLREAHTLSQLQQIKQQYGEVATWEAWAQLSEREQQKLKAIADGSVIKQKSKITMSEAPGNYRTQPKQSEPLWQLTDDILELDAQFTAIDDEPDLREEEKESKRQQIFETWVSQDSRWQEKVEAVASWIKYKDYLTEARAAEYRRIRELTEQAEREASRTKAYLMQMMEARGVNKVEGVNCRIHIQKNGGKAPVVLDDTLPIKLPEQFQKVSVEPDKQAIREALEQGEDLGFAYLGERRRSLRIK